jgi:hypothetical protein
MEHIRLDLVVGELDLPALVVELDEIASRKALRVDERRDQCLSGPLRSFSSTVHAEVDFTRVIDRHWR